MKNLLKAGEGKAAKKYAKEVKEEYALLGLFKKDAAEYLAWYNAKNAEEIPAEVKAIADERWAARTEKNWAKSDELRAKLTELGYAVKDSKEGYTLSKI